MRYLPLMLLILSACPAAAQSPMGNVSRTITENAVRSTTDSVGKATAAEQQGADAARTKTAEDANKGGRAAEDPKPTAAPPPPASK